jgi:NitT/TauT family transport system substrate-binding protein
VKRLLKGVAVAFSIILAPSMVLADDTTKVSFVLDWIIYGRHAPYFVAVEKGIFAKHKLDVKVERGYGSAAGLRRLGAGQADFLFADFGGLVLARANENLRAKMVALIYAKNNQAVFSLNVISKPADLIGKRIAAAPGSTLAALFPGFLRANSIDPTSVKLINVDVQALNAVLLAKQFDGMLELNFNEPLLEKQGSKEGLKPKLMLWADNNYSFYANGIIATDEMIEKKPEVVRSFVAAIIESLQYSFDHQEEACQLLRKNAPSVELDVCLKELQILHDIAVTSDTAKDGIGYPREEGVLKTISIMKEYLDLKNNVSPQDVYTTKFLASKS